MGRRLAPQTLRTTDSASSDLSMTTAGPVTLEMLASTHASPEEQFHCFDAFTGSGSDPPYSEEYSQIYSFFGLRKWLFQTKHYPKIAF